MPDRITRLSGERFDIGPPWQLSALEIKRRIEMITGIPECRQRLVLEGATSPLDDEDVPYPDILMEVLRSHTSRRLPHLSLVVEQ